MGFFQKWFGKKPKASPVHPEDLYTVTLTPEAVHVTHPARPAETIRWDAIETIVLVNTDEGPWQPDIWLVLTGGGTGCSIPQGAEGWMTVYDIISTYPGFNFDNAIRSAACTGNEVFELWQRPGSTH